MKLKYLGIFHKPQKVVYTFSLRSLRFFFCVTLREIYNQTFHVKSRKKENAKNAKKCKLTNERCQYLIYKYHQLPVLVVVIKH